MAGNRAGARGLPALAAGLTTLTPLTAVPDGHEVSSVARHAFGAVAASAPAAPGHLALLLIQEFQRAKLGAVLDLYDLYDPADNRIFPTPWGEGKCRIEALLQAAYAHLAVTDFWRVERRSGRRSAGTAECRFRECQAKTDEAIGTLLGFGRAHSARGTVRPGDGPYYVGLQPPRVTLTGRLAGSDDRSCPR